MRMLQHSMIWLGALTGAGVQAAVLITHFNTFPLLDSDGTTPLQGTSSSGDVIQVIDAGLDGIPALPNEYGLPSGDDLFLGLISGTALTHVADNEPAPNWNLGLYNDTFTIPDGTIGKPVYLRFWNGVTPDLATHYGESDVLTLPPAPILGPAFLDFVPTAGSSRITNIPFTALVSSSVPEPGTALALGLAIFALRTGRNVRRQVGRLHPGPVTAGLLVCAGLGMTTDSRAQLTAPLDVTASRPILGPTGDPLAGSSPDALLFGYQAIPGCLVQVLNAGPNGKADLPSADGSPAADDTVVAEVKIGQGIAPSLLTSGGLSSTIFAIPAPGAKLYARAFNAPTRAEATHWGQSAIFTFQPLQVMDLSQLGLLATTLPLGVDLANTDSDQDGQTDLEELLANTSAVSAADFFRLLGAGGQPSVRVAGKAGRRYVLERTAGDLSANPVWETVQTTSLLSQSADLLLADPAPPAASRLVYRLRVLEP